MKKLYFVLVTFLTICSALSAADYVYPTIKGTKIRDYSKPGYRLEKDRKGNTIAYPTLKGTSIRDYSKPGFRVETDKKGNAVAYPTLKGTSIRDYSKSGYRIEKIKYCQGTG